MASLDNRLHRTLMYECRGCGYEFRDKDKALSHVEDCELVNALASTDQL